MRDISRQLLWLACRGETRVLQPNPPVVDLRHDNISQYIVLVVAYGSD